MKNIVQLSIVSLFLMFISCKKCEDCYLIEEDNGRKVETFLGEFCEDEIKEQEAKEYIGTSPTHAECR